MRQELRPYQLEAIESLRSGFASGLKRQILVAPTGAGKTTICAHIIEGALSHGKKVLFIAHRKELIEQASARLDMQGLCNHGIIMSSNTRLEPNAPIQVASIQTLSRREMPHADLIIIDEAHHSAADSYSEIFEGGALIIGMTATPWRQDGRGLDKLFDDVIVAATPAQLMRDGYLCEYGGFRYSTPELSGVKTVAGDFEQKGLQLACSGSKLLGSIVDEWMEYAFGMSTILFAVNIEHAKLLESAFAIRSIKVETITHKMSNHEREKIIARVRDGTTRIVCNVGILTEGIDIPGLECAILARPTKSLSLYLQQVGRVLRTHINKRMARIHDHGGNVERHGLPDADRDYSLQSSRKKNKALLTPIHTCPACFAIFGGNPKLCPSCKAKLSNERKPDAGSANAIAIDIKSEISKPKPDRNMLDYQDQLIKEIIERGYKPGYLIYKFKKRFPNAPIPWGAFNRARRQYAGRIGDTARNSLKIRQ